MATCKWKVDEKNFTENPHKRVLIRVSVRIDDHGIKEAFFPDDCCLTCNQKVEFIYPSSDKKSDESI